MRNTAILLLALFACSAFASPAEAGHKRKCKHKKKHRCHTCCVESHMPSDVQLV
jgi:hypothetical protein